MSLRCSLKNNLLATFSLLLVSSSSVYAEVMDKEPALISIVLCGIIGSLLAILSTRFKPWLLLLAFPFPALYFYGLILEINDPYVGPAILNEAGSIYIYSAYLLSVLLVFSPFIGMIWRKHNKSLKSDAKIRAL
jgi:uncharacterized membrane protein